MRCPKRPEMEWHRKIAKQYPELLSPDKETINPENWSENSKSLIEPKIEYNPNDTAELVIKNARIGKRGNKQTADIAVRGNVITKIGNPKEIEALTDEHTEVIDAGGNSVVPGFVDSHLHLTVAMQRLRGCNVEDVRSAEEFKKRTSNYAKQNTDSKILYVFGLHYLDKPVIPADSCRHTLDEIVSDKPLIVYAHDMHTAWANTKALEQAGQLHKMPPYPHLIEELGLGGKIVLGKDKIPTGEFQEPEVYHFVTGPLKAKYPLPIERQLENLKKICRQLTQHGITGVHRMGLAQPAEDISFLLLLFELQQRGELPIRVNTSISAVADNNMLMDVLTAYKARNALNKFRRNEISPADLHDELVELLNDIGKSRHEKIKQLSVKGSEGENHTHIQKIEHTIRHIRDITHNSYIKPHSERDNPHRQKNMQKNLKQGCKVRCDTIKIFMDGIIEKDTAYRLDKKPTGGIPEFRQKDLDRLLPFADKLGMQVSAHSIGDGSVRSMLDAISRARRENKSTDEKRGHKIPHRIEHIELCREEDLQRFGKEKVVASMQPLHEREPVTLWHKLVPKKEWPTAFAWREAIQKGAVLVFGSDWPIVSSDVRKATNHAVTRKPWYEGAKQQGLDIEQARGAYTTGPAFTEYSQKIKGSIQPGMLADMVVLDGDIHELEQQNYNLEIAATICDGKIVYEK